MDLEIITEEPPNAAVPLGALTGLPLSQERMYIRSAFPVPEEMPTGFDVVVPGREDRWVAATSLSELPQVELDMVLECAGNGRTLMDPVPSGVAWGLGGASPIRVRGVLLDHVVGDLPDDVSEVVFTGADSGKVKSHGHVHYQFSLPRHLASSPVPILATHIGGEPLDTLHGAPVRLIVPGHYAMKSVKWLIRVEAVTTPFNGHFVERYRYLGDDHRPPGAPVDTVAVRSVIATPADSERAPGGSLLVSGSAWSGTSPVASVEVSCDGGKTWLAAQLDDQPGPWAAVRWSATVEVKPGTVVLMSRATDELGNTQPTEPRWNANGYANNVVHRVAIVVSGANETL